MVIKTLYSQLKARFAQAGLETPELDARLLLEAALNMTQEDILRQSNESVDNATQEKLEEMAQRRLAHEPVSRILGTRHFWKGQFLISKDTLDPRADSETLVEAVLKHANASKPLRILDIGTGTGCLLLSLLQDLPLATGIGIDISADAIKTATANAQELGLSNRAAFITTHWNDYHPDIPFDAVISNPPYIPDGDIANLPPEVRLYDPAQALAGGVDGLTCYREIIGLLPRFLAKNGFVFLEIGHDQAKSVPLLLSELGFLILQAVPDLSGHTRCLVAHPGN